MIVILRTRKAGMEYIKWTCFWLLTMRETQARVDFLAHSFPYERSNRIYAREGLNDYPSILAVRFRTRKNRPMLS